MNLPRKSTLLGIKDAAIYLTSLDPDGGWTVGRINYYTFGVKRGKPIKKRVTHATMKPQNVGRTLIFTQRQLTHWLRTGRWSKARPHELVFDLAEVVQLTGLTRSQIDYRALNGLIHPQKVGGNRMYTYADLATLNLVSEARLDAAELADRVLALAAARGDSTIDATEADEDETDETDTP